MIELVLEFIGEFLLQACAEVLINLGFHSLAEPFRRPPNPWLAAFGYAIFGAVFGGLSLLVFPDNLVPGTWRLVNLIVTPIAVGGVMMLMGAWRARRGEPVLGIDRFAYGYIFAFTLALIRFQFAN